MSFLRVTQVAEKLGVCSRTVHQWIKERRLPAYRFGSRFRVAEEDLEQFIRSSRTIEQPGPMTDSLSTDESP